MIDVIDVIDVTAEFEWFDIDIAIKCVDCGEIVVLENTSNICVNCGSRYKLEVQVKIKKLEEEQ